MIDFTESIFLDEVTTGVLLYAGAVSELSSSGLLLSSVSFPLLPKLHPPLSLSGNTDVFLELRREFGVAVGITAFLTLI